MSTLQAMSRNAYYAVISPPVAFAPTGVRARVLRRTLRTRFDVREPGLGRVVLHTVLAATVGLVAWFVVFLAAIAAVRGIFYPLVTSGDYENSWGGPTLAGAWAVHAALGVGLLPVWTALLAGIGCVQRLLAQRLLGRSGPWWPIPVALVLAAAGVVFFIAWTHQA
ncbi:sensor domain-containing protein [Nocardia sp. NPDC050406]|uniref:sensor domain-containing protein n=1 Tax=Nocardia sp. NPDC050406 TaxID=3364318 RepID=UPI00379AB2CC